MHFLEDEAVCFCHVDDAERHIFDDGADEDLVSGDDEFRGGAPVAAADFSEYVDSALGTLFNVFSMLMKAKSRIESDAEKAGVFVGDKFCVVVEEVDAGVDEAVSAVADKVDGFCDADLSSPEGGPCLDVVENLLKALLDDYK